MSSIENLSINSSLEGFVKIWQFDPIKGCSKLLVDKKNLILKGGAKVIAHALGGDPSAKIWGMYIGYNNNPDFTLEANAPSIDVNYTNKFINFVSPAGYLREKLTFAPSYLSSEGYEENTVLFSTMITSASSAGGADFGVSSQIYEVALVAINDIASPANDTVFSRTNFNPIQYNSSYNFTITWGVRILIPTS
jgi:hypothetical protein